MKTKVKQALANIRPLFEADLRKSIASTVANSSPYGYALLLGEDLYQASPIAVTNSESALANLGQDDTIDDMRYIPDEWSDWHNDHFQNFRSAYDTLYSEFEKTHTVTNDDCCYTDDALEFMDSLYDFYIDSMKGVTKEFESIWYWIIWISDSDRDVINKSFFELNSGRAIEEAKKYFS